MKRLITKYYLIILILFISSEAFGQQLSQYSQYLNNYYLINSAATDIQNSVQSFLDYRMASSSYEGAPRTISFAAYAPLSKPAPSQYMKSAMRVTRNLDSNALLESSKTNTNHLAGLSVTSDELGLFQKTTIHASYTYHLTLSKKIRISASPKIGYVNLRLSDNLTVLEDNDQPFESFIGQYDQMNMMDFGFGLWLYSESFFFGYSVERLFQGNNIQSTDDIEGFEFKPHHFALAGTRIPITRRWTIIPSTLFRITPGVPFNFDLSVKAVYGDKIWGAISYRKESAMVLIVGGQINDQLAFNYSFDHSINALQTNQISAHEISLQFQFLQNLH